jgi:ketosteroid isomerase-like protein
MGGGSMSQFNSQLQTIHAIYTAFGKADVPAILTHVSGDAQFSFAGGSKDVPWHGPWRGHADIQRFFTALGEGVEFQTFEPLSFAEGSDAVAVRLHLVYKVRGSGRVVDEHQVHWWSLRDGKVVGLTHFEDTAQVIAAARG